MISARFPRLILPCALLLFSPIVQSRQRSPQQEEPVVKLETDLVEIDVVVTDKKGKIVDGLKQEEFLLREDGKPQEISFFSFIRSGATATPAATAQGSSSAALAHSEKAFQRLARRKSKTRTLSYSLEMLLGRRESAGETTEGSRQRAGMAVFRAARSHDRPCPSRGMI